MNPALRGSGATRENPPVSPSVHSAADVAGDVASDAGPRVLNLLGWAGRTDVERVQRYTHWSLQVMLPFFLAVYLGPAIARAEPVQAWLTLALTLVMMVVGARAVAVCLRRWPTHGVPWREPWLIQLLVVLVAAVGWSLVMDDSNRIGLPMGIAMVAAWGLGGLRGQWVHLGVLAFAFGQAWLSSNSVQLALVVAGFAAFMVFTMQSSLWMLGVVRELDRARHTQAELAVAQERLRFASDVHDVMGRHLSTIAVQSELAAALLKRGDERAAERIEQVRASAHEALREARELARGYRPLDLDQEVEGAISLLGSAGARVEVTPRPLTSALAPAWHEPVARVVREAVTNVLRHSRAAEVSVSLDGPVLTISNDGVVAAPDSDGSGLSTVAGDLTPRGAELSSERTDDTFTLTLVLPLDAVQRPGTNLRSANPRSTNPRRLP